MAVPYAETVERFLQRLGNEGRSPRTLAAYRYDLDDTMTDIAIRLGLLPTRGALSRLSDDERAGALARAFEAIDLAALTADQLDEAIAEFRGRPDPRFTRRPHRAPAGRAPSTVARRTAAIRSLFAWCYRTGRIGADPAALLSPPRKRKRLPRAIDGDTAARVLGEDTGRGRWPERDQVILALALACGLRLEEIARARLDDLEGRPRPTAMIVRGKGDKERRLGVPPVVLDALDAYLPTRAALLERLDLDADTIVVSTRPRDVRGPTGDVVGRTVEASRETVAYAVDRILRAAGVRRPGIRVHALRHTFATLGLREGAFSLRQLQVVLGHASLATTQLYTEVSDEEISSAMRLHPLGRAAP